jgi:hypothetical protein
MIRLILALTLSLVMAILLAHGVAYLDEVPAADAAVSADMVVAVK